MKKAIALFVSVIRIAAAFAQQDAQFSQNMFNKLDMNPAYAGTNRSICGTALIRKQWVGFDGAPSTGLISVDAAVDRLHGGLGLTLCSDQLGFDKTIIAKLSYAYHQTLQSGASTLSIGVQAGAIQKSINGNWLATDNYQIDPSIPNGKVNSITYDFGVGAYYTNLGGTFFGISTSHVIPSTLEANGGQASVTKNFSFDMARHYYVMGGQPFYLNQIIKIIPSFLIKSDLASTQLDINTRVVYKDQFWAGASYRITDAVVAMVGVTYKGLKIGYAFDLTTSQLKNYSNNTHEIMLSYCIKQNSICVPPEGHGHPRFL